jgi:transcription-repair coupling factor (superfamily II helicase)
MQSAPAPTVLVTDTPRTLEALYQDYHTLSGDNMGSTAYFPGWENLTDADLQGVSPEIAGDRLQTLTRLHHQTESLCVFTDIQSLLQPVPPPARLAARTLSLSRGDSLPLEALYETLLEMGYRFEAEVTDKGEAAKRGGVLDIWPPNHPSPVRLDFFGNELDSLRSFDPATQRSLERVDSVQVLPARETSTGE